MNENFNQTDNNEITSSEELSFGDKLLYDLKNGLYSRLYKGINDITITDSRIRDAFKKFISDVECAHSVSVMDILTSAENVMKGKEPNINAGNVIYAYSAAAVSDKRFASKLIKNSVSGIYALFVINNGISIDLEPIGGDLSAAETKRFLILPPKKVNRIIEKANELNLTLTAVGEVLPENLIIIKNGGNVVANINKIEFITQDYEKVVLSSVHFNSFKSGYCAAMSFALLNSVTPNNVVKYGLQSDISMLFASAIGFYLGATIQKDNYVRCIFSDDSNILPATARPNVSDGDYFYLLRVKYGIDGLPDKVHFIQLLNYLKENKRLGIIKSILPVRNNLDIVLNTLAPDGLVYDSLTPMPKDCFGVAVCVGRGESLNGIKLGYFRNKD